MPSCIPLCSAKKLKSQTIIKPIKLCTRRSSVARSNAILRDSIASKMLIGMLNLHEELDCVSAHYFSNITRSRRISLFARCLISSHRVLRVCILAFDLSSTLPSTELHEDIRGLQANLTINQIFARR